MQTASMDLYVTPVGSRFLVYRPLRPLAFVANAALVHLIAAWRHQPPATYDADPAARFLHSVGFFEPDNPAPAEPADSETFEPTIAVCLLTTGCNLRCVYCYASAGEQRPQTLSVEHGCRAIETVCRNAQRAGLAEFQLSFHGGGEPTVAHPVLQALVGHARSQPLRCRISVASNGYWGHRQREWLLDHLDEVSLSYDGSQVLQDRQRPLPGGRGTHALVIETIREMDRRDFPYGLRLTVTDSGIDALPDAVAGLCASTGCRTLQVEPAFDHGRAARGGQGMAQLERFSDAFLRAHDIAQAAGRHLYYSGARPWSAGSRFCQAIEQALIVAPEGGLTACYEVFGDTHPLAAQFFFGSLSSDGALYVDTAVRQRLRRRIAERRQQCRDCFCRWHCAGDCPAKSISADEDGHLHFGSRCDLNRRLTKDLLLRRVADAGGVWRGEAGDIH